MTNKMVLVNYLKIVLCMFGLYIFAVNCYPTIFKNSSSEKDDKKNQLLRWNGQIDFHHLGSRRKIQIPKKMFTVLSNANNIQLVKQQLKSFQKQQIKRLSRYSLRSNNEEDEIQLYDCKVEDLEYIPCETRIVERIPEVILDRNGKELTSPQNSILNMAITAEACRNPDKKCKFHQDSNHRNKQSLCEQVYSSYTLFGTDVAKNTFNTTFKIESGCQCVLYENGKKVRSECPRNKYMYPERRPMFPV